MTPVRRRVPGVAFEKIRAELDVPAEFSAEVLAEAEKAARSPRLPDADDTDIPFVTLDPAGSTDLDQALHIARAGAGYLVNYAIADVGAFVKPGGALDAECWKRGTTLYSPDLRTPLHPQVLSEGAASLLPDQVRPALLWQITLDAGGEVLEHTLRRTRVKSVAKLNYVDVQADFDDGKAHESLALLKDVGELRLALAIRRNSINLDLPEQEVEPGPDGAWTLAYRDQTPCEKWNAEISLLTGMVAAKMMVDGAIGILRTLPAAPPEAVEDLKKTAASLGVEWPKGASPSTVMAALDRTSDVNVAFLEQAAHLLRGAGYTDFVGTVPEHAGIASIYAHVTAPLRRLVDRYGNEVCLSLAAGVDVPQWVREALPKLPEAMASAAGRESRLERAVIDTVEAMLLKDRVGESFEAVVVGPGKDTVTIVLDDPAVRAKASGGQPKIGDRVKAVLTKADPDEHLVEFELR
ncbi:exoribonuclease R [Antricoccus suffuscus]|uniref:Exoribonuclease R n=1 Tax=Antricoccus suffuscus TaxID=1629062 RepID=A0A2T0ZYA3_9ACTN|nr:RNB domain-containing ribonuclease [Antricoccus suffuscus]PRZ41313.1 exoribonuclease R [Antricoccus suffuscus]